MKSFRFRLFAAALAVLMGSAIAKSQTADAAPVRPAHAPGFGMGGHMEFLSKKLNLTDEQKSQMKAIMQKERPTMRPLIEQQHQLDLELRQYSEGSFDEAKVRGLATQKSQIQAQLTVEETRIHNEMYQVLTSDQQSQLKQMEADREARIEQHMKQAPPAPAEQ
jgi:Spy/CpxP family protein refolding chaperone